MNLIKLKNYCSEYFSCIYSHYRVKKFEYMFNAKLKWTDITQ